MIKTLLTQNNTINFKILFYFLFYTLFSINANAQGTTCATATPIIVNGACLSGTITDNTQNIPTATGCSVGTFRREGWYTFTITGGLTTITITANAADRNLFLQLISTTSDCTGTLSQISCGNTTTTNGAQTETITTSLGNGTYYLKVLNVGNNNDMILNSLCITAPPSNATCVTATSLACGTTNLLGTTVGTSSISNGTGCSMGDFGVWYTFIGDGNGTTISSTATFDHEMSISSGTCGTLTNISCNDIGLSGGTESTSFTTVNGTVYYVYISHYLNGSTTTGTFTISRSCFTPFNPCATIPDITTCGTTTNTVITAGNGAYSNSSCGWSTPGNEQIYTFTPLTTGNYSIQQFSSFNFIDYQYKVASSGCNSTGWICIDDLSGASSSTTFNLTAGIQYYFLLDPESDSGGNVSFIINCPAIAPTNDECASAIALLVSPTLSCTTSTSGTTSGSSQSQSGCIGTADDDVWYSFVATSTSHIVTINPSTISDIVFQVFSGSCGSLSSVDCVDNTVTNAESTSLTSLIIGNTYFVRVYSYSSGSGQGNFTICITTAIPCSSGTGIGTSALGCPNVLSGGIGLAGVDPPVINSCLTSSCTDLEATYLNLGQTTNYTVESISYLPPYQYNCLQNSVSINVDDVWSPIVNLPFNFCYYGTNYNQCLIGSNGVLTFDLISNTPSGTNAWSYNSNLPNNTLFLNTIFGVYHDIDPSKGGEVGWELITLSSGCRALVASWSDIPMFSSTCNSQLYTGMIVLYENTNIIEVYIKEKNVCSSWNSGNGIVGIQNNNGTQAVVAPNRNGTDTDWTTSNEAWRFIPSGTSITTLAWHEGAGTSGPIIGTSDTITVCPTTTTTYTAVVTYTLCNGSTLTETDQTTVTVIGNKVWNGSIDSDWNKNNNWTPTGIPNATDCVVVPITSNNPIVNGVGYIGLAGNLSVLNGATLTVSSNNTIAVTDQVSVSPSGTFIINDDASLVQINNPGIQNTGNITMNRVTNIRLLDYVYWSSPVANFPVLSISPATPLSVIWKWNPSYNGTDYGIWVNANENMIKGKGYIVRGPSGYSNTATNFQATFIGVPNNGITTTPILHGTRTSSYPSPGGTATMDDDNWNLIGNPYPSSIDALTFLAANPNLDGSVRVWTHGLLPSTAYPDPFYQDYVYNYSVNDYINYNNLGSTPPGFLGKIGAGQSFFVLMNHSATTPGTAVFNNSMRNASYSNNQFYRVNPNVNYSSNIEKHRVWINITDSNLIASNTLIGYAQGATIEKDRDFDAIHALSNQLGIYSLINNKSYIIQGRPLPFNQEDIVPLGISIPTSGNYTIAINKLDGLFENTSQNIYLEDTLLGVIHDLKANPYSFSAINGVNENRFFIRYSNNILNNDSFDTSNSIKTIINQNININSNKELIDSILVFDLLGRKLSHYKNINSNEFSIKDLQKNNSTLLLKIKLQNGSTKIQKVIY